MLYGLEIYIKTCLFYNNQKKIDFFSFKNILFIYSIMTNKYETDILTDKDVLNKIQQSNRVSIPILTKFEKPKILGMRIQQLTMGASPLIETKGLNSYVEIAEEELRQKKTPYIIRRRMANGKSEYWSIEELIQLD
jgi:DNA-directed RNA polymerases I, II, and III subunit RPABC2